MDILKKIKTDQESLFIIPLGGCGDFGMNITAYVHKSKVVIIDAGAKFPSTHHHGVQLLIPKLDEAMKLLENIDAYVMTHGHEDHIGSLPYLLEEWPAPIWAPGWARELIRKKYERNSKTPPTISKLSAYQKIKVEGLEITPLAVNHSIPDAMALLIEANGLKVFHSGDFKIDPDSPYEEPADLARMKKVVGGKVDVVLADSTNASKKGRCPSESVVIPSLKQVFSEANQTIVLATFSSNLWRLKTVVNVCRELNKKLCVFGSGLYKTLDIAKKLYDFEIDPSVVVQERQLKNIPKEDLVVMVTGCQGERNAALAKIINGHNRSFKLRKNDLVLFSSRIIPGNEVPVLNIINRCEKLGCKVITQSTNPGIHVSGHGYREDLNDIFKTMEPDYFVPIHGSFYHLRSNNENYQPFKEIDFEEQLTEMGHVFELSKSGMSKIGKVNCGFRYIDARSDAVVSNGDLRQRTSLAENGTAVFSGVYSTDQNKWMKKTQMKLHGMPWPENSNFNKWRDKIDRVVAKKISKILDDQEHDDKKTNDTIRLLVRSEIESVIHKKALVSAHIYLI